MNARVLLILVLTVIWFGGSTYWYVCKIKGFCGDAPQAVTTPTPPEEPKAEITLPKLGLINFNWSDFNPVTAEGFPKFRDSLLAGLDDGHILEIIGNYFPDEEAPEGFENMGLARANAIKSLFAEFVDGSKIRVGSKLIDMIDGVNDNPFESSRIRLVVNNDRVQEIDDKVFIYFPYNSDKKDTDPAIDSYLTDLAANLIQSGKNLVITGHTDNKGAEDTNYELGLMRAKSVKEILVSKGVDGNKITAQSKGETDPIESNETDEGRRKNRRTELSIQ